MKCEGKVYRDGQKVCPILRDSASVRGAISCNLRQTFLAISVCQNDALYVPSIRKTVDGTKSAILSCRPCLGSFLANLSGWVEGEELQAKKGENAFELVDMPLSSMVVSVFGFLPEMKRKNN